MTLLSDPDGTWTSRLRCDPSGEVSVLLVDVETQNSRSARLHLLGERLDMEAAEDQVSETQVR